MAVSCALDGSVIAWDAVRGKAVAAEVFVLPPREFVNPPLAHCLDVSDDGRLVAVALGSGSVAVLEWKQQRLQRRCEMTQGAHTAAASAVRFVRFAGGNSALAVSGGNDRRVCVWDAAKTAKVAEVADINMKVNWIETSGNGGQPTIFVCGDSNDVAVFRFR
jgi:WD40 repeat protein